MREGEKMKYYCYGNASGIDSVIKREIMFNHFYAESLKQIINYVENQEHKKRNIKIIHYAYDDRLQKEVYMVVADHSGYKEQFELYFIEESELLK